MKKFSVVVEVSIEETKYDEIKTWEVEPSDHVTTLLTEPLREKGMVVKAYATEVEHSLYDRQKKYVDHLVQADAYNDIENELIARACIGGVCED